LLLSQSRLCPLGFCSHISQDLPIRRDLTHYVYLPPSPSARAAHLRCGWRHVGSARWNLDYKSRRGLQVNWLPTEQKTCCSGKRLLLILVKMRWSVELQSSTRRQLISLATTKLLFA